MSNMLQDRIARAAGAAARVAGQPAHAYRPRGAAHPLAAENRYLRLPVLFHVGARPGVAPRFGTALCQAVLDSAYTRPGDYLAQGDDVYFIAAQPPFGPVLCVRTNRILTFRRAAAPAAIGANPYQAMERGRQPDLLTDWPASMLGTSRGAAPDSGLPDSMAADRWAVLLPPTPGIVLRHGDILADDLGRTGTVQTAESTAMGWRLSVTGITP